MAGFFASGVGACFVPSGTAEGSGAGFFASGTGSDLVVAGGCVAAGDKGAGAAGAIDSSISFAAAGASFGAEGSGFGAEGSGPTNFSVSRLVDSNFLDSATLESGDSGTTDEDNVPAGFASVVGASTAAGDVSARGAGVGTVTGFAPTGDETAVWLCLPAAGTSVAAAFADVAVALCIGAVCCGGFGVGTCAAGPDRGAEAGVFIIDSSSSLSAATFADAPFSVLAPTLGEAVAAGGAGVAGLAEGNCAGVTGASPAAATEDVDERSFDSLVEATFPARGLRASSPDLPAFVMLPSFQRFC